MAPHRLRILVHFSFMLTVEIKETYVRLALYLLVSSATNFCKQFGPQSGLTKCWAQLGDNLYNTQMVFLKECFEEVDFEKNQ